MEGKGEDAVCGLEGGFHAVAVVDVDVDVEDALVLRQEVLDGEHDVVDVAEARGSRFSGVMQAAGPVDGDVGLVVEKGLGGVDRGAAVETDVVPESFEDGAVVRVACESVTVCCGLVFFFILRCDPDRR